MEFPKSFCNSVLLAGITNTGKKTLINQLIRDCFGSPLLTSSSYSSEPSVIPLYNKDCQISIYRYNYEGPNPVSFFMKLDHIVIFMIDITNKESFDQLIMQYRDLSQHFYGPYTVKLLLGHKSDCKDSDRKVSREQLKQMAETLGVNCFETSVNRFGNQNQYIYPIHIHSNNNEDGNDSNDENNNNNNNNSNVNNVSCSFEQKSFHQSFIEMFQKQLLIRVNTSNTNDWYKISLPIPLATENIYPESEDIIGTIRRPLVQRQQDINIEGEKLIKTLLFKNIYIRKLIWGNIKEIHKGYKNMGVRIDLVTMTYLIRNQYWSAIKWIFPTHQHLFRIDARNLSCLLRTCPDYHLLLQFYIRFPEAFDLCVRGMDELCIGGCVEMYEFLYNKGPSFRCSKRGFQLACQFGHLNIIKFIVKYLSASKPNSDYTPYTLVELTDEEIENSIKVATYYKQEEVVSYLESLRVETKPPESGMTWSLSIIKRLINYLLEYFKKQY